MMMKLYGHISTKTFALASKHYAHIIPLIEQRMGLSNIVAGTLNIQLSEEYLVKSDATISPKEYGLPENLKLQRAIIHGYKAIIIRPDTHEIIPNWGHGIKHIELMSVYHLKQMLQLKLGDTVTVEIDGNDVWWNQDK